jgi:hypothetical protein
VDSLSDSKAKHGVEFKEIVLEKLLALKSAGLIKNVEVAKQFAPTIGGTPQFYVPFYAHGVSSNYAIYTTTSARSDRIKINQWDANGIKVATNSNTICIVILPDSLSDAEEHNFEKEVARISQPGYVSAIDSIIKLKDLERTLE